MKHKMTYIILLLIIALVSSCENNLEDNIPDSKTYIVNSGETEYTLYDTGIPNIYKLSIYRSGKNGTSGSVRFKEISEAQLSVYNTEHGTDYVRLPSAAYTIPNFDVNFDGNTDKPINSLAIELDPAIIRTYTEATPSKNYVIPMEIESSTWEINTSKSISFVKPVVKDPLIYLKMATAIVMNVYDADNIPARIQTKIPAAIDFDNQWDLTVDLTLDEDEIDKYNKANETFFSLLPRDLYTLADKIEIPAGDKKGEGVLEIIGSKLSYGNYMLPIIIGGVSKFNIDQDRKSYIVGISIMAPRLDRSAWKIIDFSSEEPAEGGPNGLADAVLDGDLNTFWHSKWNGGNAPLPHHLSIDMQEEKTITHVGLARRNGNSDTKTVEIYISGDNLNWTRIGKHEMETKNGVQISGVYATKGRYLKVMITESRRSPFSSLSEIEVFGF